MAKEDLDLGNINFGGPPNLTDAPPKNPVKKSTGRPVGRPSKSSTEKEISDELSGMLKLIALTTMSRDIHEVYDDNGNVIGVTSCIMVYVDIDAKGKFNLTPEGTEFCDAAAGIIVETPFLMKILKSGDKWGNYLRLFLALQPLVLTVINNHLHARKADVNGDIQSQVA